jgi:hypothetical protein
MSEATTPKTCDFDDDVVAQFGGWNDEWPLLESMVPSMQTPGELAAIRDEIVSSHLCGDVLEIGTAFGGTALLLARWNARRRSDEKVLSVDSMLGASCETQHTVAIRLMTIVFRYIGKTENSRFMVGTSDDVRYWFRHQTFRFALIDGDHTTEWILRDVCNVAPLMVDGATILLHDICDLQPLALAAYDELVVNGLDVGGVKVEAVGVLPGTGLGKLVVRRGV